MSLTPWLLPVKGGETSTTQKLGKTIYSKENLFSQKNSILSKIENNPKVNNNAKYSNLVKVETNIHRNSK